MANRVGMISFDSIFFSAALGLLACGQSGVSVDAGTADQSAPAETLTSDEKDASDRGSASVVAFQQLSVIADELFAFDPTIDPGLTDIQNAQAIQARISASLGPMDGGIGCGTATRSSATVTVGFAPPPGCILASGVKVSGTVAAAVTKSGTTMTILLTFTSLAVNGQELAGTASFVTSSGSAFTVNANLMSGSTTFSATGLTITGGSTSITINGSASTTQAGATTTLSFGAVTWQKGQCYPSSGTLKIQKGLVTETVTFLSTTPTTGQATMMVGPKKVTVKLPAYDTCGG